MSKYKFIDNLILVEKLIRRRNTGTPKDLAHRLSVSRSAVYNIIDELKLHGADIKYCRTGCTFYYDNGKSVEILFEIKPVAEASDFEEMSIDEMKNISGGAKIISTFCFRPE